MELLDIVDEDNNLTGEALSRKKIHEYGFWHRHVSSWIMNKDGKILLQKRAACKKRNPNRWAKTGGHVDSGETVEEAIIREIKEEIGIDIPKEEVKVLDVMRSPEPNNRYFVYNFIFLVDHKIEDYTLQKGEVSSVKYFTIEEIENAKKENNLEFTFSDWSEKSFNEQMELLKNKRKEIIAHFN